jgi:hypothetical protein
MIRPYHGLKSHGIYLSIYTNEYRIVNKTVHMNLSFHHVVILCTVKWINMSLYYWMQLTHCITIWDYNMVITTITYVFMQDVRKIWTSRIIMLILINDTFMWCFEYVIFYGFVLLVPHVAHELMLVCIYYMQTCWSCLIIYWGNSVSLIVFYS